MMKLILSLFVCCLVSSTLLMAQTADEKAVAAAVEKLRKAMIAADKTTLEGLAAEELSYGHSNGLVENRSEFVNQFLTKKTVFLDNLTFSNQTIRIVGNDAIVRHRLTSDTNNSNVPGKVDILILMVWQKQNGEWKLLARQAAKVPPKV
ncbi:nuclear transport factor 2 family protein [Chryseolinea sp. H1M3-3]|uniref:nuclear transport factor 2 family protein n=1 Tax=Chryseolinea sp. H1M3-3 TaxID=3034144 RepID=UPI0023ED75E8|nr:nuclear transport factor 2 family protein [Chryseolinea sp. H1M3-3]